MIFRPPRRRAANAFAPPNNGDECASSIDGSTNRLRIKKKQCMRTRDKKLRDVANETAGGKEIRSFKLKLSSFFGHFYGPCPSTSQHRSKIKR